MIRHALLVWLLPLLACTPTVTEAPGVRDGYTMYKGRTTVAVKVDPNIARVQPDYPR